VPLSFLGTKQICAGYLDQELLSLKKFEGYVPVDFSVPPPAEKIKTGPTGKYMVLGKFYTFF